MIELLTEKIQTARAKTLLPGHSCFTFSFLFSLTKITLYHTSSEETSLVTCQSHYLQNRYSEFLMLRILHQDCPIYLCDLLHFVNIDSNRSCLRSDTTSTRADTAVNTPSNLDNRAFSDDFPPPDL